MICNWNPQNKFQMIDQSRAVVVGTLRIDKKGLRGWLRGIDGRGKNERLKITMGETWGKASNETPFWISNGNMTLSRPREWK